MIDAADNLRVVGSQEQPVAMPELDHVRHHRALMIQGLRALALPDTEELAEVKAAHMTNAVDPLRRHDSRR